jgi:hypothetical protein
MTDPVTDSKLIERLAKELANFDGHSGDQEEPIALRAEAREGAKPRVIEDRSSEITFTDDDPPCGHCGHAFPVKECNCSCHFPPASAGTCMDCGAPMNEGEARTFTVCDACWTIKYPKPASAGTEMDAEKIIDMLKEDYNFDHDIAEEVAERVLSLVHGIDMTHEQIMAEATEQAKETALILELRDEIARLKAAGTENLEAVECGGEAPPVYVRKAAGTEGLGLSRTIIADVLEDVGNAYELRDRAACEKWADRIIAALREGEKKMRSHCVGDHIQTCRGQAEGGVR